MKCICIFCVCILYVFFSFSQEKIFSSDCIYIINNKKIGGIIDDFVEHEKQYASFSIRYNGKPYLYYKNGEQRLPFR